MQKKILCVLLVVLMVLTLAACKKNDDTQKPAGGGASATQEQQTKPEAPEGPGGEPGTAEGAMIPGKLYSIDLDDRDPSVLRGLTLVGNRAGGEEFNGRDPAAEDIRCIFELNEYVGFYPDTDVTNGIVVYILQHRDDQKYYETATFSDLMPGFANLCRMDRDPDGDETTSWGEFYLNPDDHEAGYYDFVFTYDGKAIATLLTRFYGEGELESKSDAELEQIITGLKK